MTWKPRTRPWAELSEDKQQDVTALWLAGNLRYKLDPTQRLVYDAFYESHKRATGSAERWFYLDASRQVGKDFLGSTFAVEACMTQERKIRIPYAAPTRESTKELLVPTLEKLFQDCPPPLLPLELRDGSFTKSANRLTFPQYGSEIVLVGMDLHPGRLRGPATFACILSEAGFMRNFSHTVRSVIVPQLMTEPDGWFYIPTTPPETPAHDVDTDWLPEAKRTGRYWHLTIDDNPRISQEQRDAQIRTIGGTDDLEQARKSTLVRRELFAEHVVEESLAVIPEWPRPGDERRDLCVREFERPRELDCYVALDPGVVHFCAALFAFYNFTDDTLYIEGDFAEPGLNTWQTALRIWAREWQLWGIAPEKPSRMDAMEWAFALEGMDAGECIRPHMYEGMPISAPVHRWAGTRWGRQPFRRVSDTDLRLIADLSVDFDLAFTPTPKDDLQAAINNLRLRCRANKVVAHPRCVNFISHMDTAIWGTGRRKFAESGKNGHFDAVAAGIYLDRNVVRGKNPCSPPHLDLDPTRYHIPIQAPHQSVAGKALSSLFENGRSAKKGALRKSRQKRQKQY